VLELPWCWERLHPTLPLVDRRLPSPPSPQSGWPLGKGKEEEEQDEECGLMDTE